MRLNGKTAIVTGGGRGIGRATALALAQEGANVIVSARTQTEIEAVAAEAQTIGQKALAISADVTKLGDIEELAKRTHSEFGSIDILVNNAGGIPPAVYDGLIKNLWEMPEADWDRLIDANLKSVFLCMKVVLPYMIAQKQGHVVNIASKMGRQALGMGIAYTEAKHAVIALTKNTAKQAAPSGVRVNALSPGLIDTPGQKQFMESFLAKDKLPPMDTAESVAAGVVYLLCDTPQSMTGQSLDLFDT